MVVSLCGGLAWGFFFNLIFFVVVVLFDFVLGHFFCVVCGFFVFVLWFLFVFCVCICVGGFFVLVSGL